LIQEAADYTDSTDSRLPEKLTASAAAALAVLNLCKSVKSVVCPIQVTWRKAIAGTMRIALMTGAIALARLTITR
jgi:hypothetical protein